MIFAAQSCIVASASDAPWAELTLESTEPLVLRSEPIGPIGENELESLLYDFRDRARAITAWFRIPPEDGEDLLQETLLTYVLKRERIYSIEGWLAVTLRRQCIMYWRRRQRSLVSCVDETILELLAPARAAPQETEFLRRDLDLTLAKLSPRCRSVIRMRYHEERPPLDVASSLGYRPASIYKVLQRCLSSFSRRLVLDGFQEACNGQHVDGSPYYKALHRTNPTRSYERDMHTPLINFVNR